MATDPHSDDSRRRILARALEIVGDREELARRLHTRPILLDAWLAGVTAISERIFLQAVDIVLGEGEKPLADVVPLGTTSKPERA